MDELGVFAVPAVRQACPVVTQRLGEEEFPEKESVRSGIGVAPALAAFALVTQAIKAKKPITQTRKPRIFSNILTAL
jgi:hypothetical protein